MNIGTEIEAARRKAAEVIRKSGITITYAEAAAIEVADFGLGNLPREGAQILTFFNSKRVSAKVIVLFPTQTLPEHWHPPRGDDPGKEETIRVVAGMAYCLVPGDDTLRHASIPEGKEECYTCRQEVVMKPCDQITFEPGTKHWLQAGPEGAVLYSLSTQTTDAEDKFSDPDIARIPSRRKKR